jgi:hypothetical protein
VEGVLTSLARDDKRLARELALHLLSLRKEPRPAGSRELQPLGQAVPGGRVWTYPPFEILYRVDDAAYKVSVGEIVLLAGSDEHPARRSPARRGGA